MSILGIRIMQSLCIRVGIVLNSSEKERNKCRLIIYSRLAFGSLVVMVEGFYSSTVRTKCDVNTLFACRLLPLPILGNCGCFASKATSVMFREAGGTYRKETSPQRQPAAVVRSSVNTRIRVGITCMRTIDDFTVPQNVSRNSKAFVNDHSVRVSPMKTPLPSHNT